jgi:hypothetical protein
MVHQELWAGKRMHPVTAPQRWLGKRKILKNITDPVERVFSSLPSHGNGQLSRMDYQPLKTRWHKAKEQTSRIKSKHNIYLIARRKRRQTIWKTNPSEAYSLYGSQQKIYWRYVIRIPRNRSTIFLYYCWEYPGRNISNGITHNHWQHPGTHRLGLLHIAKEVTHRLYGKE